MRFERSVRFLLAVAAASALGVQARAAHGFGQQADPPFRAYVLETSGSTLTAIDTATHEVIARSSTTNRPSALDLSPDGSRVFVAAGTRIEIFEAATLRLIHSIGIGDGVHYFAPSPDNTSALGFAVSQVGATRVLRIDGIAGTASSVLAQQSVGVIGVSGERTALAVPTFYSWDIVPVLSELDLETGAILREVDVGGSFGGRIEGQQAYVFARNLLKVLDVASLEVIETFPLRESARGIAVGPGNRAYVVHGWVMQGQDEYGGMSVIDLTTGRQRFVDVPGGYAERVAVTPDGALVYVSAGNNLVAFDAVTLQLQARIPVDGSGAIAIGPVPSAEGPAAATPTPRVIVRAHGAVGIPNDNFDFAVALEGDDLRVARLEHTLATAWNAPIVAWLDSVPECRLEPHVAATATFEFAPDCLPFECNSVSVRLQAEPGTSLPYGRPLYSCTVHTVYWSSYNKPILVLKARATDADGRPVPAIGGDGEITVIDPAEGTPHPTRPRPSTYTPTSSPTSTPTPLPVMVAIGSASFTAGDQASIDVVLTTNGAAVAALQNDILFRSKVTIAATTGGLPACRINPEIDKPASSFAFQPTGCDPATGECTGIRALVVSLDRVDEIADGSVLYTCTVSASVPGVFTLLGSGAVASAPNGRRLPVEIRGGLLTVAERIEPPTSTATNVIPTDTPLPDPTDTVAPEPPEDTPASSDVSQGSSGSARGSGCGIANDSNSPGLSFLAFGLLILGCCRRSRRLVIGGHRRW